MKCPWERIWTVRRVRASCSPNTVPALAPVKVARSPPDRRRPRLANTYATSATAIPAKGQLAAEPSDTRADGMVRDSDSAVTPAIRIRAPMTSERCSACRDNGPASNRAKIRLVASSGSARESWTFPMSQADSNWPATMVTMPASQRGLRSRSSSKRRRRYSDFGSCCAAPCWRTNPAPSRAAATTPMK